MEFDPEHVKRGRELVARMKRDREEAEELLRVAVHAVLTGAEDPRSGADEVRALVEAAIEAY